MNQADNFLDRIKRAEYEKLSDSQFVPSLEISLTANYINKRSVSENIQSKVFKKSSLYKILFTCFAFGILILTIQQHVVANPNITKVMGGYFVAALLIVLLFTQVYFGKKTIKRILLDANGITIDNRFFDWGSIAQTAIMIQGGKYKSVYLVLGFKDLSSYQCYELNEFASGFINQFSKKISTYIEYFKPKT